MRAFRSATNPASEAGMVSNAVGASVRGPTNTPILAVDGHGVGIQDAFPN